MPRVLALFLLLVSTPLFALSLGPEMPLSASAIEPAPFVRFRARAASNGDGFLVAWVDQRTRFPEVRAARVDRNGELIDGTSIRVAEGMGTSLAVASDGRDYMVAYNCALGDQPSTCLARVEADSGRLTYGGCVARATGGVLASNGEGYLLAYLGPDASGLGGNHYIDAVEVGRDASVTATPFASATPFTRRRSRPTARRTWSCGAFTRRCARASSGRADRWVKCGTFRAACTPSARDRSPGPSRRTATAFSSPGISESVVRTGDTLRTCARCRCRRRERSARRRRSSLRAS